MAEGRMLSARAPSADIDDDSPCVARRNGRCEQASARERWPRGGSCAAAVCAPCELAGSDYGPNG